MPKTFNGAIKFPSNFDVQATRPLDDRLVVDSYDDLINGSITYPYQGMVVNIKGTSELWILKTQGVEASHNLENWELVTGSGISEEVEQRIQEIWDRLGLTESDVDDVKEDIETLKRNTKGASLSNHILPVMTQEMADEATADSDIDFDESEDPHILVEYNPLGTTPRTNDDIYMGIIRDMMGAIRSLQAEVARLRNSFDYGIVSYNNTRTAKSVQLGEMDVEASEPLWAIDPGYLSLVPDSTIFNTLLDINHRFIRIGTGTIDTSIEGQLTFNDCKGVFYDGNDENASDENLTLYKLNDSKLITYIVSDKPSIKMNLISLDDKSKTREVEFEPILMGNTVNKYGFCVVISRKVKVNDAYKGFNYIYFSIINYENDEKLFEGYLNSNGILVDERVDLDEMYSIQSIEFDRLTLSRMKFYTKFEDFSEEVISSAPSEKDYKYEVAHLAIRSVKDTEMLNEVADYLMDTELVWNKKNGTLHIKSDGKIYKIGSNNSDDEHNKDNNMTDKEIIQALERMGIVVNVEYKKDEYGDDTDEIKSLENISLAPISDVTFINEETNKKFTFKVDTEGNLVGKDNSATTIDEFMKTPGTIAGKYDVENYQAVRGFVADYLARKKGTYSLSGGVNKTGDAGKLSDRLRISSFYAPITTDERHGCTHSFIELENSSEVDIPLTGVYLHFYNPAENDYSGAVHHLALDGVIKAGGTYLVRGAKHAEFEDESAFIKVKTFDKEWYENGKPVSFEQEPVKPSEDGKTVASDSNVKTAYRFCLTYGLPDLAADEILVRKNTGGVTKDDVAGEYINVDNTDTFYDKATYPNIILNPRFIDSCSYSTFESVSEQYGNDNPWYANGDAGKGIVITKNSMFRLMFALDPAKQAYNGFNGKDSSRIRYNKATDIQVVNLDKEFIGYPHSNETVKIDRYTPKASFENKNIMTDKSQLDREKPNMVTCSFGVDVYNTRCFNWISCGTFDEYVWIRKKNDTDWISFSSYEKVSEDVVEKTTPIHRKEYSKDVNNAGYARIINRFPGNDVLFTSHKCVVVLPDVDEPTVYEYVVGRPDKDGNPDPEHTNRIFTFTLYPRTYEGRVYQVTDQQGFHWIEYQVWAASAEFLNKQITEECTDINSVSGNKKVFPILINTGDMTQSGARVNEWLDYYNAGISLFDHLEQMNCVGNNDLCPINPRELGTGNDNDKSNSRFFHYFYCFDVKDTEKYDSASDDDKKFFSGETLVVKAHTGSVDGTEINIKEDRFIPSTYYFKTSNVLYVMVNSEIPYAGVQKWFGLCSDGGKYINIYTGIESANNGNYAGNVTYFTPIYETIYAWLKSNQDTNNKPIRKVVVAMHEMPFTVITKVSLTNDSSDQIDQTRNHPTKAGRLGSNVNQLNINENRGIYWCSRLLEYFNCKLVIGGHKHTYALSYPIKEKYSWTKHEPDPQDSTKEIWYDSKTDTKPMFSTLSDEAGENPTYEISWKIDLTSDDTRNEYNVSTDRSKIANTKYLNSTKTPYIPQTLYESCGEAIYDAQKKGLFRCCSLIDTTSNSKYDGFVNYSMCQATGYKLKSNKELPSQIQVFSKIIPKTNHKASGDSPNADQLYPMYSVLEFNNDCSELNVTMNRITGIFASLGKDTFTQTSYGKGDMDVQTLCTDQDGMYGNWMSIEDAEEAYNADIKNRYLHIIF